MYAYGAKAFLTGKDDIATQSHEVARLVFVDRGKVCYRLKESAGLEAVRTEGARSRRDDVDGFHTPKKERKDISSNDAGVRDCVDLTIGLVGNQ